MTSNHTLRRPSNDKTALILSFCCRARFNLKWIFAYFSSTDPGNSSKTARNKGIGRRDFSVCIYLSLGQCSLCNRHHTLWKPICGGYKWPTFVDFSESVDKHSIRSFQVMHWLAGQVMVKKVCFCCIISVLQYTSYVKEQFQYVKESSTE